MNTRSPRSTRLTLATLLLVAPSSLARGQCSETQMFPSQALNGNGVGQAVALTGRYAFVGFRPDTTNSLPGRVTVFRRGPSGWSEVATLAASDGVKRDLFGSALSASGDLLLVSAPLADSVRPSGSTRPESGAVYVFELEGGVWVETAKLLPRDPVAFGRWGLYSGLHTDGRTVVVGWSSDDTLAKDAGSVYVLQRSPAGWAQTAKLFASDIEADLRFGQSLSISGGHLLVGSSHDTSQSHGSAYAFERTSAGWTQVGELTPPTFGWFGDALDVDGDVAVVKWRGFSIDRSAALLFEWGPYGWVQTQILSGFGTTGFEEFGRFIDVQGDRIALGAPGYNEQPFCNGSLHCNAGAVYLYERELDGWQLKTVLEASDPTYFAALGESVVMQGDTIVAGATGDSHGAPSAGLAYVFRVPRTHRFCAATANSTGAPAGIHIGGCASITENRLAFVAAPVPDRPALLVYGSARARSPFGPGWACVGGSRFRLPPTLAVGGVLRLPLDLTSPPGAGGQITAGSTWHFQAWFREAPGAAGSFQLSDGISVTFEL